MWERQIGCLPHAPRPGWGMEPAKRYVPLAGIEPRILQATGQRSNRWAKLARAKLEDFNVKGWGHRESLCQFPKRILCPSWPWETYVWSFILRSQTRRSLSSKAHHYLGTCLCGSLVERTDFHYHCPLFCVTTWSPVRHTSPLVLWAMKTGYSRSRRSNTLSSPSAPCIKKHDFSITTRTLF